jgi:hypothetical protein
VLVIDASRSERGLRDAVNHGGRGRHRGWPLSELAEGLPELRGVAALHEGCAHRLAKEEVPCLLAGARGHEPYGGEEGGHDEDIGGPAPLAAEAKASVVHLDHQAILVEGSKVLTNLAIEKAKPLGDAGDCAHVGHAHVVTALAEDLSVDLAASPLVGHGDDRARLLLARGARPGASALEARPLESWHSDARSSGLGSPSRARSRCAGGGRHLGLLLAALETG